MPDGPSASSFPVNSLGVKCGVLKKKCTYNWAMRYVVLDKTNKIVHYYKSISDKSPRRSFPLLQTTVERSNTDDSKLGVGFSLSVNSEKATQFVAANELLTDEWFVAITRSKTSETAYGVINPNNPSTPNMCGWNSTPDHLAQQNHHQLQQPVLSMPLYVPSMNQFQSMPIVSENSQSTISRSRDQMWAQMGIQMGAQMGTQMGKVPMHTPSTAPPMNYSPGAPNYVSSVGRATALNAYVSSSLSQRSSLPAPSSMYSNPSPKNQNITLVSSTAGAISLASPNPYNFGNNTTLVARSSGDQAGVTLVNGISAPDSQKTPVETSILVIRMSPDNRSEDPTERDVHGILKVGRFIPSVQERTDLVTFKSKVISRNHAEIWSVNGEVYLRDTRSQSGTFLNATRLSEPSKESKPYKIKSGDHVQFGVDFKGAADDNSRCVSLRIELTTRVGVLAPLMPNLPQSIHETQETLVGGNNGTTLVYNGKANEQTLIGNQFPSPVIPSTMNRND